MPFERPPLDTLIKRVEGDVASGLNILTIVRRTFLGVFSRAIAGMSHLMLGFLTWIARQVFPDTAELEFLNRWGAIWGVFRNQATFAQFQITFTGTDGGVIPILTLLKRDDGTEYKTDAEGVIAGGSALVQVTAEKSGANGDMAITDKISLISPIANVDSEATVTTIVTDADDTEEDEPFRERLINKLQLPPLGGSANDYVQWAKQVTGVTRSWVLPLYLGPGTVGVSFVVDDENPIIPIPAKVTEVNDYILALKPVTALLTTFAPTEASMVMDISIKPNNTDVQAAILTELKDFVLRDAQVAGSYKGPTTINDGSLLLSQIRLSISIATGLEDFEINTINGIAPSNVVPVTGELITLGAIAWQTLP